MAHLPRRGEVEAGVLVAVQEAAVVAVLAHAPLGEMDAKAFPLCSRRPGGAAFRGRGFDVVRVAAVVAVLASALEEVEARVGALGQGRDVVRVAAVLTFFTLPLHEREARMVLGVGVRKETPVAVPALPLLIFEAWLGGVASGVIPGRKGALFSFFFHFSSTL